MTAQQLGTHLSGAPNRRWEQVAADFDAQVRAHCGQALATQILRLHQPHIVDQQPVCRGCDRERGERDGGDPVWPCRTYTIIASTVLCVQDIEATLERMLTTRSPYR